MVPTSWNQFLAYLRSSSELLDDWRGSIIIVRHANRRDWCVPKWVFGLSFYGHFICHFKHDYLKVINKLVIKVPHCFHMSWVDLVVGLVAKSHVQNHCLAPPKHSRENLGRPHTMWWQTLTKPYYLDSFFGWANDCNYSIVCKVSQAKVTLRVARPLVPSHYNILHDAS